MAIYHLHVKVIGRKAGSSAVASAAYRSASRMRDERIDRTQDFSNKRGVVHSEVLLPENAPEAWSDRERLWNGVEAFEVRKDAQLAREVEFAIPREMTQAQGIELARDFAQAEFVDQGMIADLNVHWDIGEDGMPKPHAHVMLTMRSVDENGFGPKVRDWNPTLTAGSPTLPAGGSVRSTNLTSSMTSDRRDDDKLEAVSRPRHTKRPPTASEQLEELLGYPWPIPGRPPKHDLSTWTVTDDWPDPVPVTQAEIEVFERWFGDLFDELFGSSDP